MIQRLIALIQKEFIQIRRDRRTLGMMIALPLIWLVLFGYAFSFDVHEIRVAVIDLSRTETGKSVADALRSYDRFVQVDLEDLTEGGIREAIFRDRIQLGVLIPRGYGRVGATPSPRIETYIDGSNLFAAQTAARLVPRALQPVQNRLLAGNRALMENRIREQVASAVRRQQESSLVSIPEPMKSQLRSAIGTVAPQKMSLGPVLPETPALIPDACILYNPDLKSANVMIPGLLGLVVMFMTTMMTALGVVREREYGTMEQLVVTPIRPVELILGKLMPYFIVAAVDFALVFIAGVLLFDLTFAGNLAVFLVLSMLLVFTTLGLGLLISTVAQNQQQAMQLAMFVIFPQIILSGLIFPLDSLPRAIQAIARLFPFTYYVPIARGMFIKGQSAAHLLAPALVLAGYAIATVTLASLRFRKRLG